MPAKNKIKTRSKSREETKAEQDQNVEHQLKPQNVSIDDPSKIQISSAQAEMYFEYLRKKISHQSNDPFSLPFLNLKFEQLESWKGATQQLNLQSRIYGMRVDNCHDYTMKMLNYVIRNQEQQIGRHMTKSQTQIRTQDFSSFSNQFSKMDFNFHLQKAEKLQCHIQVDKNLSNHSLWKMIFKKSETFEKIQLNTLEISSNLSLEIDEKNVKYMKRQTIQENFLEIQDQQDFEYDSILAQSYIQMDRFMIFKKINTVKTDINRQIEEILANIHSRRNESQYATQQPLYETFYRDQELDFDGIYQQFNEIYNYQQDARVLKNSQKFGSNIDQEENRDDVFVPVGKQLYEIPIDHLNMMSEQIQQYEHEQFQDADENQQECNELYEPHKELLFHSTIKKNKGSKRVDNRVYGKRRKHDKIIIDFQDPTMIFNRKTVLNKKRQVRNNIQNDNLVPINYVVLYENRNPFRKQKKLVRTSNRVSFYDNISAQTYFELEPQPIKNRHSLQIINVSQSYEQPFFSQISMNNFDEDNAVQQEGNQQTGRKFKNVSMKTVKNEIKKEISNIEESFILISERKNKLSNFQEFSKFSETSAMDTCFEEEARMIGLRFLKHKMLNYDPLDILMSMLHVAYQTQVLLQPVYSEFQEDDDVNFPKLQDIIIRGEGFL